MKLKVFVFLALVLAAFMMQSCDTGSSDNATLDIKETDKDSSSTMRSPLASDRLPAPLASNAWYRFANDVYGMAITGVSFSYNASSFTETCYYWDGDSWETFMALKGTLAKVSGTEYDATLTGIYITGSSGLAWYESFTTDFANNRSYVWSKKSNTARISLADSGSTLEYKRDQNGDNSVSSSVDYAASFTTTPSTSLSGHGKYPYTQYASWAFQGNGNRAYSSIQPFSILGAVIDSSSESVVSSITGRAKDQNGNSWGSFTYSWNPTDNEWEGQYFVTGTGGLWWLSEIVINYKNGATATYTASDPWTHYQMSYKTDTGYTQTAATSNLLPGQDYMPPVIPGTGNTFMYIRTFPNGSSPSTPEHYTDTRIYIYSSSDTTRWLAANDDWCSEFGDYNLYSTIKYPFKTGETYYIKVEDLNDNDDAYSIIAQADYAITPATLAAALSAMPASPDSHEEDDTPATATALIANTAQDHTYTAGDADWMKVTF